MRKWIAVAVAALLATAGAAFLLRGQLAVALVERGVSRNFGYSLLDDLPDGLHALVCGSGSPLADRSRAGPCLAVIAGDRILLVDAGDGASETLQLMSAPVGQIERVLLTHMHSDHIDGLDAVALNRWVGGASTSPLPLQGPAGVEQIAAGLNAAFRIDAGYRVAHHGPQVAPPGGYGLVAAPFAPPAPGRPVVIHDEGGLRITAFAVPHGPVSPAAVGYRFDYKGRSLSVSGDTAKSESLIAASKGVDLMVHEALSPRLTILLRDAAQEAGRPNIAKIFHDILDYHASPAEAAESAQAAGARALLLTHLIPPLPLPGLEGPFLGDARSRYDGPLWVARDGELVSLPADSDAIIHRRLTPR